MLINGWFVTAVASAAILAGCAAPVPTMKTPDGMTLVAQSHVDANPNESRFSSFEAPQDGVVEVYDVNATRLLYTGPIKQGQTVRLLPDGAVLCDEIPYGEHETPEKERLMTQYTPGDEYYIYFSAAGLPTPIQNATPVATSIPVPMPATTQGTTQP